MSRFLAEKLLIGIAPQAVSAVRVQAHGWSRAWRVVADHCVVADSGRASLVDDACVETLRATVRTSKGAANRNSKVAVNAVLDDGLLKYFVVQRSRGIRNLTEARLMLAARFEEQFGLSAKAWMLTCAMSERVDGWLAAAMPRVLLASVDAACKAEGVELVLVQGESVARLQTLPLPRGAAWLINGARQAFAYSGPGGWRAALRLDHAGPLADAGLRETVEREALLRGLPTGLPLFTLASQRWPAQSQAWNERYTLAISGMGTGTLAKVLS